MSTAPDEPRHAARWPGLIVAVAAGFALADASIVVLALPDLLAEFDTTVVGVAAVIVVYTGVLCVSLLPAWHVSRRVGVRTAAAGGLLLFAAASIGCAVADSLGVLLVGRAVQAVAGAAVLVAAFVLLHAEAVPRRRLWLTAAILGTAVGPAVGGALTQLLDWRAIFVVQAPVAVIGAIAAMRHVPVQAATGRTPLAPWPACALACVSGALTGVLLLLVLLLVAGWNLEPLEAAAIVTAVPLGAVFGGRITSWDATSRAAAGCLFVAAGVLALAWLPEASAWWTIGPKLLAGVGMGLALPALGGELLPERTGHDAATLLTVRHIGIVLAVVVIAPITADRLTDATAKAKVQGVSLFLDAKLAPQDKFKVAPGLLSAVRSQEPRKSLRSGFDAKRADFAGDDAAAYDELATATDDVLITSIGKAFRPAFLIVGAFALLGALVLGFGFTTRPGSLVAIAAVLAVAAPVGYAVAHREIAAEPVTIADPCDPRSSPGSGGITGFLQDQALKAIDRVACENGSSREALVMALADDKAARAYAREYGVNPRTLEGIVGQARRLLGID